MLFHSSPASKELNEKSKKKILWGSLAGFNELKKRDLTNLYGRKTTVIARIMTGIIDLLVQNSERK